MSKFKVGDKVKLKSGFSCTNLNHINTYTVRKSYDNVVELIGLEYPYPEHGFNLIEQSNDNPIATDILTPLEAAEALLNKDSLQIYDINDNKWYGFHSELRNITLEDLKHVKLRYKPKTVIINGVEVPAPLSKKPSQEFIYFINLFKSRVYQLPTEKLTFNHKNYWGTSEDARKALDAMLIPFKDLNIGDK